MARNKMFGVAAYLVAVVAIGGGVLVTWVLLFVGIAAAAAGTKALERARLYSHFPSYDDLRARRIAERQAQRSLLRGAD